MSRFTTSALCPLDDNYDDEWVHLLESQPDGTGRDVDANRRPPQLVRRGVGTHENMYAKPISRSADACARCASVCLLVYPAVCKYVVCACLLVGFEVPHGEGGQGGRTIARTARIHRNAQYCAVMMECALCYSGISHLIVGGRASVTKGHCCCCGGATKPLDIWRSACAHARTHANPTRLTHARTHSTAQPLHSQWNTIWQWQPSGLPRRPRRIYNR